MLLGERDAHAHVTCHMHMPCGAAVESRERVRRRWAARVLLGERDAHAHVTCHMHTHMPHARSQVGGARAPWRASRTRGVRRLLDQGRGECTGRRVRRVAARPGAARRARRHAVSKGGRRTLARGKRTSTQHAGSNRQCDDIEHAVEQP